MKSTPNSYVLLAKPEQDKEDVNEFNERLMLIDPATKDEILHNVALLVRAGFSEMQAKVIIMRLSKFMNLPKDTKLARVQNGKMIAQMIRKEIGESNG